MVFPKEDAPRLLSSAIDIGEGILCAGGEVDRVESTISLIMTACGAERVDLFVIPSSIVVTVSSSRWGILTQSRAVGSSRVDLKKLSMYNQLSREICACPMSLESMNERIAAIRKTPEPARLRILTDWSLAAASFCLFFGGSLADALISGVLCAVLHLVHTFLKRIRLNDYYAVILASALGGALIWIPAQAGLSSSSIAMGCVMLFVPGIALTNSIRDMFSGDLISGLLRFAESALLSLVIAFGFAFTASSGGEWLTPPALVALSAAFFGSFSFARLFGLDMPNSLIAGLTGLFGWLLALLAEGRSMTTFAVFFFGSAGVTLASEILCRIRRCPVTVFLVTGIIPMVPGGLLYLTMRAGVSGDWSLFSFLGLEATLTAAAIAAGIIAVTALADVWYGIRRNARGT